MSDEIDVLYNLINLAHPDLLKAYPSMHDLKPTYMVLVEEFRKVKLRCPLIGNLLSFAVSY